MIWFYRIVQGILIAVFLMSGFMKLFVSSEELYTLYTVPLGYDPEFMKYVGGIEVIAAIGLITGYRWSILTFASSGIITVIMAGATISTLFSELAITEAISPFIMLMLSIILLLKYSPTAYIDRRKLDA